MSGSHGDYGKALQYWNIKSKQHVYYRNNALVNFHHIFGNKDVSFFRLFGFSGVHKDESLRILDRVSNAIKSNPLRFGGEEIWANKIDKDKWCDTQHDHGCWDKDGFLKSGERGILTGIPAGYTYLWQIALHDVSHTSVPITGLNQNRQPIINTRSVCFNLETVFGGGPAVCPRAYVLKRPGQNQSFVGMDLKVDRGPGSTEFDVQRYRSNDGGERNEALIADPRNEDNQIIGQLTGLIHAFHNRVVARLEAISIKTEFENNGVIARAIVAQVFRRVIIQDLMSRLLDERVFRFYATKDKIDKWGYLDEYHSRNSVPVELAHAVGRIGHFMIRPKYNINATVQSSLGELFTETARRDPESASRPDKNYVDWQLFFPLADVEPDSFNWSAKFELHSAGFLNGDNWFGSSDELYDGNQISQAESSIANYTPKMENKPSGLFYRDLVRAASVGNRTVTSIAERLAEIMEDKEESLAEKSSRQNNIPLKHPLREILLESLDGEYRQSIVKESLLSLIKATGGELAGVSPKPRRLSNKRIFHVDSNREPVESKDEDSRSNTRMTEVDFVAADPPLLIYCISEARKTGGKRLGPLASVILAETFFGAFDDRHRGQKDLVKNWKDQVNEVARNVFSQRIPASMPEVIRIVRDGFSVPEQ